MEIKIEKIKIIDRKEGKYGEYRFKSGINIINGNNKSGKSSLVKSIMYALGYEVIKWDPNYNIDDMIFILSLNADNKKIELIRYKNNYIINNILYSQSEYRVKLYKFLKLSYQLLTKTASVIPYPTDLFMFHYIDQDTSWSNKLFLNNHYRLNMYTSKNRIHELNKVYENYIGIKNYEINHMELNIIELNKEIKILTDNRSKIEFTIKELKKEFKEFISIDLDDFKYEIKKLECKLKNIYIEQNKVKYNIFYLSQKVRDIEFEITDLKRIYENLKSKQSLTRNLICNTCNSHINTDMFLKKYQIENDITTIFDLYNEMIIKKKNNENKIEKEKEKIINLKNDFNEIKALLFTRKNNITLREAFESSTNIDNDRKLNELINKIDEDILNKNREVRRVKEGLKLYKDGNAKINDEVINSYNMKLDEINLLFTKLTLEKYKDKFMKFDVNETGSTDNLTYTTLYYIYLYILSNSSNNIKLPFILDTIIKTQYDKESKLNLNRLVNEKILKLDNQIIYSYTEEEYLKIDKQLNFNEIKLSGSKRICYSLNGDIENEIMDLIIEKISEIDGG